MFSFLKLIYVFYTLTKNTNIGQDPYRSKRSNNHCHLPLVVEEMIVNTVELTQIYVTSCQLATDLFNIYYILLLQCY